VGPHREDADRRSFPAGKDLDEPASRELGTYGDLGERRDASASDDDLTNGGGAVDGDLWLKVDRRTFGCWSENAARSRVRLVSARRAR